MTPIGILNEGLQVLSSWLMSVLVLLALLVSVIICLMIVEVVFQRGALARAYTVKTNPSDGSSDRIET
jgi:hypothetical protein